MKFSKKKSQKINLKICQWNKTRKTSLTVQNQKLSERTLSNLKKRKKIPSAAYVKPDVKPNTVSQGPNGKSPDIDIDKTKSESDKEDEDKNIGPKKAQKDDILNNNVTEPKSNKNMEKPKSAENLDEDLKNTKIKIWKLWLKMNRLKT